MELRDIVLDWLVSPETVYLIGAGCSVCAGKPLIGALTEQIVPRLRPPIQDLFDRLKGSEGRAATIEDLMNHLIRRRDILSSLKERDAEPLTLADIDGALDSIRPLIVERIRDDWVPVECHQRFLQRVRSTHTRPRDIFTLNYDTVLEATLEALRLPYTDGFIGGENAYFDASMLSAESYHHGQFRLFKMHGSINWVRDEHDFVRRRPVSSTQEGHDPIVVYPSEQKYLQTQYGVYEILIGMFRDRLRNGGLNNRLVCIGYSFNDEHINEAIIDAVRHSGNNLCVYAFVGPERYDGGDFSEHRLRLGRIEARCSGKFNFFVGSHFHLGHAIDPEHGEQLLRLELWRFETLVGVIAGQDG